MTNYFIVPGLGNSGEGHWQSYFKESAPNVKRIEQEEWETPKCEDWVKNISEAISGFEPETVVLIGHSLGCVAIANWAKAYKMKIKGALLVAPSDVEAPKYTFDTVGFKQMPVERIDFKTILVASSNDEWMSMERAKFFAESWGSQLINIGEAGHINATSGFGEWKEGLAILKEFE